MINGFSEQTKPLTDYEKTQLVPIVAKGMRYHRGKANAVTSSAICKALTAKGYKIDGARLRKVMNHIRLKGIVGCIIATSDGYYISDDLNEITAYIQSLEGRANAILAVRNALINQINK